MSGTKESTTISYLNKASGKVSAMQATGQFAENALAAVVNFTPKAGNLDGFEAPKQPSNSDSEFKITINISIGSETLPDELVVMEKGQSTLSESFTGKLREIDGMESEYRDDKKQHDKLRDEIEQRNAKARKDHGAAKNKYDQDLARWTRDNKKVMKRPGFDDSGKPIIKARLGNFHLTKI
jgi:hypothetical protein